jgi:hypothetical protein
MRIFAYMYVWTSCARMTAILVCICVYVYLCMYMYMYMYVYINVYMVELCANSRDFNLHVLFMHVYVYLCMCTQAYKYVTTYVCVHTHGTHKESYIYKYMLAHMHTCIHTWLANRSTHTFLASRVSKVWDVLLVMAINVATFGVIYTGLNLIAVYIHKIRKIWTSCAYRSWELHDPFNENVQTCVYMWSRDVYRVDRYNHVTYRRGHVTYIGLIDIITWRTGPVRHVTHNALNFMAAGVQVNS